MSYKILRPFIVKVSVLGYIPLLSSIYEPTNTNTIYFTDLT